MRAALTTTARPAGRPVGGFPAGTPVERVALRTLAYQDRDGGFTMPGMGSDVADARVLVGLLGPVEVGPAGGPMAPVVQPRLRVLLGLLAVAASRVISAEALVDGVWGEDWSPRREQNLHTLVYQLRRRLAALEPAAGPNEGAGRLARAGSGYRLVLGPGELDVAVFTDLAARGRQAARAGDAEQARDLFGQALTLWRGAALADAAPLCTRLAGAAARIEEQRLVVVEERIGCDLALGAHTQVAGELAALVADFPLRERLAGQLITALYRCGRRGEALAAYDTTRRVLAEEVGLDPGPELAALQAQVLADDPALAAPPLSASAPAAAAAPQGAVAVGVVPRQLPAGAGFFAGRETELKELDALIDQADGEGGAVVISAVAGMAGVGKTALAVQWAWRVASRFPGGQLYVNLRGYDPDPAVSPEEAAGWFLVALGVPAAQIPAEPEARFGLYRSVLAGRRVLIVLDNARDAAQVRPLLPGSPGCLAIVTSRSALAGLAAAEGARPLRLGLLGDDEAVRLLAARVGPERVAAEPGAVTKLIARCGHLPLALAVMAARAAADPKRPLAALAAQLAGAADVGATAEAGQLEVLETGDAATSLRELLSWSHCKLSQPAAAMLALLGVHCGPDITVPAAASLAGVDRAGARRELAELADASLVAEHRPGRYVMHDLVRGYAAGQARQAIGEARIREAIGRSLDHYLHSIASMVTADDLPPFTVGRPAPGVMPEHPADEVGLLDWTRAEHQALLRATAQAAATGFLTQAWQIVVNQGWSLGGQGYWADFRTVAETVLAAADAAGDQSALGWTHAAIGWCGMFTGAHGEDRAHLYQALGHFRRAGDQAGQAWAHGICGLAYSWNDGDLAGAITHYERAAALFRQEGHQTGQGWALAGLAGWHAWLGNYDVARGYAEQALRVAPEAEDPAILAVAWGALGHVHSGLGEHRQAMSRYRQAQALARAHERKTPMARWLLGMVLAAFGDACRRAGDLPAAIDAWQQALQVLDDLGLPDNLRVRPRLERARSLSPSG